MHSDFRDNIPANKFYPPRFDASQSLYRKHLVEDVLWQRGNSKQILLIEGQAGQGKTTLVQQYVDQYKLSYAWYQVGREDRDPVLLVASLLDCLSRALPSFSIPDLDNMFLAGQVSVKDTDQCINKLLQHLDSILSDDLLIVFDDIHLIHDYEGSIAILNLLVETAPPRVRFAFMARQGLRIDFKRISSGGNALLLDNDKIALRHEEVQELFYSVLKKDVPASVLDELFRATHGWSMGVMLAAHGLEYKKESVANKKIFSPMAQEDFHAYFKQEVYGQIDESVRESLFLLSFLDEIPVDLATEVTGQSEIGNILEELRGRNFFVRSLGEHGEMYGLHHLFQEFLQGQARLELSAEIIKNVFRQAANYSRDRDRQLKALDYYVQAEDYNAVEKLLMQKGPLFLVQNQTLSLALSLEQIPKEIIVDSGWLTLFMGAVAMESHKKEVARSLLGKACELFRRNGEQQGALIAHSQLCWFYQIVSGVSNDGAKHLVAARGLYETLADSLPDMEKILVARNLSGACMLFVWDKEKCEYFCSLGVELAKKQRLVGVLVVLYVIRFFANLFCGRMSQAITQFEELSSLSQDVDLGIASKVLIQTAEVNLAESLGDLESYNRIKKRLHEQSGKALFEFMLGPYLFIWDLSIDLGKGKLEEARGALKENDAVIKKLDPHYSCQIMQEGAYLLSLAGERDKAMAWLNEAVRLRDIAGGPYFTCYQHIYVGATYCQLDMLVEARDFLDKAVRELTLRDSVFLLASALLHRCWFFRKTGDVARSEKDMKAAFAIMRKNGFTYVRSLPREIIITLLGEAVAKNIESDYARFVAREWCEKAILADGKVLPLLQIDFLGGISFCFEKKSVCDSASLTPTQRELFTILAASPGFKISQEQVQLALWPESPPEKARSSFDTLLSRCRKSLGSIIPKNMVKRYLVLQKGMLSLANCRLDVHEFVKMAEQGLAHSGSQEYWQADNAFYLAMNLWRGGFAPEVLGLSPEVDTFRRELLALFCKATESWCENLVRFKKIDDAISVMRNGLKYDPLNELFVRRLFHLLQSNHPVQARKLLDDYRKLLVKEEYEPREIKEIVDGVTQ